MSGHNKWSKIKRKKGASDAQKSKMFGKLVRYITVEAKKASGNLQSPGLKTAIEKAKEANMPNDTIDRALKKPLLIIRLRWKILHTKRMVLEAVHLSLKR
jgi:transcriptional/translational regulatory protein YebC/TACO1